MKFLIIVICACTMAGGALAQSKSDSLFVVTYSTGSAWDKSKKQEEQRYFKEHSAYLASLRKANIIKAGVRYADKGIVFMTAESSQVVRDIVNADQAVVNKLFTVDISRSNVFYEGCLEKSKSKN